MNILIIDNSNGFTGAFKCALNEAVLLSDVHRFTFVIPEGSTNSSLLKEKGFTVYEFPLKEISRSLKAVAQYPFYLIGNMFRLKKVIAGEQIGLVQVNDFYNLLGAGLKMFSIKVKLITYVRFLPSSLPGSLRNLWTSMAHRSRDGVIAVSDAVLRQLPGNDKTIRIYDAVSLDEKIKQHTIQEGITFLYLANFTRGKGQEHALAAFKKLYDTNKEVRLKYVGGFLGLEKNKLFRQELEDEVKKSHLESAVSFHEFDENIERLIKESYALLNFSEAESFSMTCLEASYYGTPVIATKCGGPEEIIVDGETGILVEKRDVAGMAAAMQKLVDDKSLRERYSDAGKQFVRNRFSRDIFKEQMLAVISNIAHKK